jgi:predicted nucleotidyltransferase
VKIRKPEKKSQSLNNYKAEGIMMKNQIVHAPKMNDQNRSSIDLNEVILKLKCSRLVHSIILFGSKAKETEKEKSDIDICVIPKPDVEITLKERISLNNLVPDNIDISFMDELPVYIRKRVFLEGKVLYTQDMYHVLTLSKINDMEYERYKRLTREYHKHVMERVRARLG